jgi:hypothetical protein
VILSLLSSTPLPLASHYLLIFLKFVIKHSTCNISLPALLPCQIPQQPIWDPCMYVNNPVIQKLQLYGSNTQSTWDKQQKTALFCCEFYCIPRWHCFIKNKKLKSRYTSMYHEINQRLYQSKHQFIPEPT